MIDSASIFVDVITDACGGEIELVAEGGLGNYTWSDLGIQGYGTMSTNTGAITSLSMYKNGTYTVEVTGNVLGGEVAIDGSFSTYTNHSSKRFETSYGLGSGTNLNGVGTYYVNDQIKAYSIKHCGAQIGDNIIAVDAWSTGGIAKTEALALNKFVWKLSSQPVKPNTTYTFSIDAMNWGSAQTNPVMMLVGGGSETPTALPINGGGTFANVTGKCNWQTLTVTWDSGTNTTATFLFAEVGQVGNGAGEIAFDNITFNTGEVPETTEVEITVNLPQAPDDIEYCIGDAKLEVGDGNEWLWLEDDKSTLIGKEDGSGPVTWDNAPTLEGDYQVSFQGVKSSTTKTLGPTNVGNNLASPANVAFTLTSSVELVSTKVKFHTEWPCPTTPFSSNITLELLSGGVVIATSDVVVSGCGITKKVDLGFLLAPGNYVLRAKGSKVKIDKGTVTRANGAGVKITSAASPFMDMVFVESVTECAPVLVDVKAKNCCTEPVITNPSNATACSGEDATFSITAVSAATYVWEYSDNGTD